MAAPRTNPATWTLIQTEARFTDRGHRCFDTLRTKEQLGYIVDSEAGFYAMVGTWRVLVQSERECKYLKERCDAFLQSTATSKTLNHPTNEERHTRVF